MRKLDKSFSFSDETFESQDPLYDQMKSFFYNNYKKTTMENSPKKINHLKLARNTQEIVQQIEQISLYEWNNVFRLDWNFHQAQEWYIKLKKHHLPNVTTFRMLLSKCKDYAHLKYIHDEMEKLGSITHEIVSDDDSSSKKTKLRKILNTLMSKASNYQQILKIKAVMKKLDIKPNLNTMNTLISKKPTLTYKKVLKMISKMKKLNIKPDAITFRILIAKAATFDDVTKIKVCLFAFGNLISKAAYEEALKLKSEISYYQIKPNLYIYRLLISKAPTYEEVLKLKTEMEHLQIKVDRKTNELLFSKAPTYEAALKLKDEIDLKGQIKPNLFTDF